MFFKGQNIDEIEWSESKNIRLKKCIKKTKNEKAYIMVVANVKGLLTVKY